MSAFKLQKPSLICFRLQMQVAGPGVRSLDLEKSDPQLPSSPRKQTAAHQRGAAVRILRRRYPSAFFTRSGVNGVWRIRTPVSCITALEIAGATSGVAIWPTPVG